LQRVDHIPRPIRALLITPDGRFGRALARVLERRGPIAVSVVSGAVVAQLAIKEVVDVILLDLPAGVSVDDVLTSCLHAAPVIVLCSYLGADLRTSARRAGVAAIHLKQIDAEELYRCIDAVCRTAPA
jgi:DNA-binding NarL/FixJ family response regulator